MHRRRRRSGRARGGAARGAGGRSLRPLGRPRTDPRRPDDRDPRPRGRPRAPSSTRTLAAEIEGVSRAVAERLGAPVRRLRARRPQAGLAPGGRASRSASPARRRRSSSSTTAGSRSRCPGPPGELRRLWPRVLECGGASRSSLARRRRRRPRRVLRFFGAERVRRRRASLEEAGGEADGLEVDGLRAGPRDPGRPVRAQRGAEEPRRTAGRGAAGALRATTSSPRTSGRSASSCSTLPRDSGLTLATAESCTGGLVGARLTDVPGSSDVFLGGVVAYSNEVEGAAARACPPRCSSAHGAVSAETAEAMAAGARTALGADVAVVRHRASPGRTAGRRRNRSGSSTSAVTAGPAATTERFVLPGDREAVRGRATALALHTSGVFWHIRARTRMTSPGSVEGR